MTNIDIAKSYIEAVQTGDQAALGELFSPAIVWHQPGNNRFSGVKNGVREVGGMIGAMMEASEGTFAITNARQYMENGDLVAVAIEFAGKRKDARMSQPGMDLLRIENGRIAEVWLFSSNSEEEDLFWGN